MQSAVSVCVLLACLAAGVFAQPAFLNPADRSGIITEGQTGFLLDASVPITPITPERPAISLATNEPVGLILIDNSGHFALVDDGGEMKLRVMTSLDAESADDVGIELTISVDDPDSDSSITVMVTVVNINDSPPVWNRQMIASVTENTLQRFYSIIQLVVTDPDDPLNLQLLTYTVNSPSWVDVTQFGRVYISTTPPAIDENINFDISITVSDGVADTPIDLILPVTFDLELPPSFSQASFTETLVEGDYSDINVDVTTVTATQHPSSEGVKVIRYTFQIPSTSFSINERTGEITCVGVVDREMQPEIYLTIRAAEVRDFSAGDFTEISFPSFTTVQIVLEDVNDNSPEFFNHFYFALVAESVSISHVTVTDIAAFDRDEGSNAAFMYSIEPSTVPFEIDSSTGVITVSSSLDYETDQMYSFSVVVTESETTARNSGTATVNITVTNVNDNTPAFPSNIYTFDVYEGPPPTTPAALEGFPTDPVGPETTMIQAMDGDEGDFGDIASYRLIAEEDSPFSVSPSGEIFVTGSLDRETRQTYHMTLEARDTGDLRTTTLLVVTLLDINDQSPVFRPDTFLLILEENRDYNNALQVFATDLDQVDTVNSMLDYSISPETLFTINSVNGVISTAQSLDCETTGESHTLTVTATDRGVNPGPLSGSATITVNVQCVNEHGPVFSMPQYDATLAEDFPVNADVVLTVSASETPDEGHDIFYSISSSLSGATSFNIDEMTGVITLANSLDREQDEMLTFAVLARDNAQDPRTGTAMVTVTITNVNDNPPIITNPPNIDPSTYTISEGQAVPFVLFTVLATDADVGDSLSYSISGASSKFSVSTEGMVFLTTALDRAATPVETFTVNVCDTGNVCDTVDITVTAEDFNDNAPVFTMEQYSNTISECDAGPQVSVFQVSAMDSNDIGLNSEVRYSTLSTSFAVDPLTGVVRTTGTDWDYDSGITSFTVTITATDNPGGSPQLTDTAMFTMELSDCNDIGPVFTSDGFYTITINEGQTGDIAGNIAITDGDSTGAFQESTFSIVGGALRTNNWLEITTSDNRNAVLRVLASQTIDREDENLQIDNVGQGRLVFQVRAANVMAGPSGEALEAFATVTVIINDVNDNSPVISNGESLSVNLVENAINNSIVAVIVATDADYGVNAAVAYSILSGNSDGTFSMDAISGHLTVARQENLDAETTPTYSLVIQAANTQATGGLRADTITVDISLTGTNDHSPIFDEDQYTAMITEYHEIDLTNGAAPDSTLAISPNQIHATDGDAANTPSGMVEYRILTGNFENGVKIFEILEPSQAVVSVLRPDLIDYEEKQQFDIVVEAYDIVSPLSQRRQDSTHLIVTVIDVNDHFPVFTSPAYTGTLVEELPAGAEVAVVPTIAATDDDMLGVGPLTFELISGPPFVISPDGTTVTSSRAIDRETDQEFTVTVRVSDGLRQVTAVLVITILDINDNRPMFLRTPDELRVNIPENLMIAPHPDGLITTVEAEDADIGNNAQITYLLRDGRGNFEIDSLTAEVTLIASLDRDLIASMYNLNITATDGELASWQVVTVIIDNVNDNNPVFLETLFEGNIDEDAIVDSTLLATTDMPGQIPEFFQLEAEDLDPESNVTYYMPNPDPGIPFKVTFDGFIITTASLDRETTERYNFFVRATDGFRESINDALVEIVIGDVNDNSPVFEQPAGYEFDVFELTPTNAIFTILQADDEDINENAEIEFSITDVNPIIATGFFNITPSSGAIFPNRLVTIAVGDPIVITLDVTARDMGVTSRATTVPVVLNLVDRNLNAPNFTSLVYRFDVDENELIAPVGITIAMDPTGDLDNDITYAILENNDGFEDFFINNVTGAIVSAVELDRETRDLYTLTISATDSAEFPRTGYCTVVVTVNDVNDNTPYFEPDSYPISVSESTSINSTLIRVLAFDDDIGANADLRYRIISGDLRVFTINEIGEISTLATLDRETVDNYNLVVEVSDSLTNPNIGVTNVTVAINDVNDNSPTFTSGAVLSSDPIEVFEDALPGYVITTIQASDPDFQLNGIVGYYFQNLTLSKGPFLINRDTGVITLRPGSDGELDRERIDAYELTIIAADLRGLGVNTRTTSGAVIVVVLDINDNLPNFINPLHEFTVPEAFALNTPLGIVEGTDEDIGENAALYYHFISDEIANRENTTCANEFCISLTTGEITLVDSLDRETQDFHLLTIAVTNNMELQFNDTTGTPIDASTGSVSVIVTDTNDQTPEFVPGSLFAVVAEEAEFGTTITTLEATDADLLNGSIVWFEIVTPQVPYLVDLDTGVVTTAGVFTGLSGTRHVVTVRAYDNFGIVPTFSTTNEMIVQVFKRSEQVIITFSRDKEVIEDKIDRIHAALVEVTSSRIIITDIRVERTVEGEVDISGTDVLFFALDPDNGNVINPAIVIRVIDENYATVEQVFSDCNVEKIRINDEVVVTSPVVPIWLWVVLGILAAAVLCLCCCFLIGCVVERRRSRRWKKKAGMGREEHFSNMSDFNTMSNPMWISPYDGLDYTTSTVSSGSTAQNSNPMYESQELTIEMFQDDGEEERSHSRERLVKAPPLSIPAALTKRSDGLYDSQEIEIQMFDELEDPDSSSDVQLVKSSTPYHKQGKPPKRRGQRRPNYSEDDDLLDEAVGGGRSYF